MATSTLTARMARRVALFTTGRESLKGAPLAALASLWFLAFLLVPLLIILFFGFATIRYNLTISYTQLTTRNYLNALDPFGHVAFLTLRTLLVAVVSALGSLAIGFPVSYYLARICREKYRGMLVSLFVIPFWISFVVQVYAIFPWVDRNGYVGGALDFLHLGGFADWLFANFGLGSPNIVAPALIYIWLPFMILPLFTALLRIDPLGRPAKTPVPDPKVADGMDSQTSGGTGVSSTLVAMGRILERMWDAVAAKYGSKILGAFTVLILAAYYVPLGQVVIFSFNHDNNIINWSSFSTRWYFPERSAFEVRALFADTDMMNALRDSIIIGISVTGISLLIGIPAALSIVRYRFGTKPFLNLMLYAGLVMPSIILGVSLLVFVRFLNDAYLWPYLGQTWDYGYASIIVGHVTFCIPIVLVVLIVRLREFHRSIEEAAMNLGADEITTFLRVTLPNIWPGIVSAALLSFTFSFSEVVVTLFLKGGRVNTLPVVFWATLSKHIPTPELNAASTLILGLSILFIIIANRAQSGGTLYRF